MKVSVFAPPKHLPAAIAATWFAAHLPFLAPSLEDIDSINFALGLRDYDPAQHQPHPPGYPVYIAIGRVVLAAVSRVTAWPAAQAEAFTLALISAVAGALAILAAARLFAAVQRWQNPADETAVVRAAIGGAAVLAVAPLFWLTGLRPMSDMPGLAAVLWAQALAVEGMAGGSRRGLLIAAVLAGLAGGIRIQTLALTLPILLVASIRRRDVRPMVAMAIGGAAWAVPLVVITGGVAAYRQALGSQAAEDFGWVNMLWSNPTARRLAFALYETFSVPWASPGLADVVGVLAALGGVAALVKAPRALLLMLVAFVPYVPYHLLFQETITVRYALPILPLVAWLAAQALMMARKWMPAASLALIVAALAVAVPGALAYAREPHPAFRALADANARAVTTAPAASFSHYSLRRPLQAAAAPPLRMVEPRRQYEWMGLVEYWRGGGAGAAWFFADPNRTDLALIDPQSRQDVTRYRWRAGDRPELAGTRPLGVDWYRLTPPGWFAGEGWSLTPETGGIASATGTGPDRRPIEAWVRRRTEPLHLVVGGRHLGNPGDPAAEFELAIDGVVVDRWRLPVEERNFLRFGDLPAGLAPGSDPFARLVIVSRSADGRPAPVAIRQFDVQPASRIVYGFGEGWHEEEFEFASGRRWRWTSERSVLRLKGPSQPVTLTIRGESPLRYQGVAPTVKVVAGGRTVGEFAPGADFEWSVVVPGEAWAASAGAVAIETDRAYLPGAAEGTGDTRRLGLRLFEIRLDPVVP
jgi:hypothetical protein